MRFMEEKFEFFYGGVFSNWANGAFVIDGLRYFTVEQYMMAEKARMFGDKEAEKEIMTTGCPEKAKTIGRRVRGFDKDRWEASARGIVYNGCRAKFEQNHGFREILMKTRGRTLVEASRTDQIWGIGLSGDDPRAQRRETWQGTNWLGEVLTLVRDDLEAGVSPDNDFPWQDTKPFLSDVVVENHTGKELWIWHHDAMRRGAADLQHRHNLAEVKVVVEGEYDITVSSVIDGETVFGKASDELATVAFGMASSAFEASLALR